MQVSQPVLAHWLPTCEMGTVGNMLLLSSRGCCGSFELLEYARMHG